jgi:hypothetical protein
MPKSRHGKGKHPHVSKKSKAKVRSSSFTQPSAAVAAPKPEANIEASPVSKATAMPAKVIAAQYPYFMDELKRISILAGIILVVLIVLSIILS